MKKHHNFRALFLGGATALSIMCAARPIMAAAQQTIQTISALTGVSVCIDNVDQPPMDVYGNPMEALIYNNVIYLPAQVVTNVSGKQVQWDQETQKVYLRNDLDASSMVYLSELDYFTMKGDWTLDRTTRDNLGNEHSHSICIWKTLGGSITYKLHNQYTRLTGFYYQKFEGRNYSSSNVDLIIWGDGRQLWKGTMNAETEPLYIDVNIANVSDLTIELQDTSNVHNVALGEVTLR